MKKKMVNKRSIFILFVGFFVTFPIFAEAPNVKTGALVIADFDTGDKPNNLNGDFGSWDKDPNDDTQSARMSFESDDAYGDARGYCVRIEYDVDSHNPAFNGFWMKLGRLDATQYNTINLALKGDKEKGFTGQIKLEVKDNYGAAPYIISGITGEWQNFAIPFAKFKKIRQWSALKELVLIFDDINSNPKKGVIYLDHITLTRE